MFFTTKHHVSFYFSSNNANSIFLCYDHIKICFDHIQITLCNIFIRISALLIITNCYIKSAYDIVIVLDGKYTLLICLISTANSVYPSYVGVFTGEANSMTKFIQRLLGFFTGNLTSVELIETDETQNQCKTNSNDQVSKTYPINGYGIYHETMPCVF